MQLQMRAPDQEPNSPAAHTLAIQANTYALLAIRDKLEELTQVLREKRDS